MAPMAGSSGKGPCGTGHEHRRGNAVGKHHALVLIGPGKGEKRDDGAGVKRDGIAQPAENDGKKKGGKEDKDWWVKQGADGPMESIRESGRGVSKKIGLVSTKGGIEERTGGGVEEDRPRGDCEKHGGEREQRIGRMAA